MSNRSLAGAERPLSQSAMPLQTTYPDQQRRQGILFAILSQPVLLLEMRRRIRRPKAQAAQDAADHNGTPDWPSKTSRKRTFGQKWPAGPQSAIWAQEVPILRGLKKPTKPTAAALSGRPARSAARSSTPILGRRPPARTVSSATSAVSANAPCGRNQ